jgi:hypothetical protein
MPIHAWIDGNGGRKAPLESVSVHLTGTVEPALNCRPGTLIGGKANTFALTTKLTLAEPVWLAPSVASAVRV